MSLTVSSFVILCYKWGFPRKMHKISDMYIRHKILYVRHITTTFVKNQEYVAYDLLANNHFSQDVFKAFSYKIFHQALSIHRVFKKYILNPKTVNFLSTSVTHVLTIVSLIQLIGTLGKVH